MFVALDGLPGLFVLAGLGWDTGSIAIFTLGAWFRSMFLIAKGFGAPFGVAEKISDSGWEVSAGVNMAKPRPPQNLPLVPLPGSPFVLFEVSCRVIFLVF